MKSFVYVSVTLMLLAVIGVSSSEKFSDDLFASIFAPSSCARACWYGIEPGVTTEVQLHQKLAELNLTYKTSDAEDVRYYGIQQEIYTKPFIEKGFGSPLIHVWDGIVNYIVLPVNIPLNLIQMTWGLPSKIEDGASIRMIYYEEKLYLEAELDDDAITYVVMAASDVLAQSYIVPVENGGPPPMSSCEGVSQAICDFVSPTFVPILRDTFKSEGCQRACWLGIEPDVTTKQEAVDILEANGLTPMEATPDAVIFKLETDFPFLGGRFEFGFLSFNAEKVTRIELPTNVTFEQIKQAYSLPNRIIHRDDGVFQIVYGVEAIVFETSELNPHEIDKMYIANDHWLSTEYVAQPPFTSLLEDCSQALFFCELFPSHDAQVVRDMLLSTECTQACFFGMQPGRTTASELKRILEREGFSYEVFSRPDAADVYEITINQDEAAVDYPFTVVDIFFGFPDVVNHIWLSMDEMPIEDVVDVFGAPAEVRIEPDGRGLHMLYPSQGLVFVSDKSSPKRDTVGLVQIMAKDYIFDLYGDHVPLFSSPTCVLAIMCSLPRATPMP